MRSKGKEYGNAEMANKIIIIVENNIHTYIILGNNVLIMPGNLFSALC